MGKKSRKKKKKTKNKKTLVEIASGSSGDEQDDRILKVLKARSENEARVNRVNVEKYFEYLRNNIEMPCILTGIESAGCFSWEEYYTFGPGKKKKYEKLKRKYPSYTDEYELLGFDGFDEEEGILVQVITICDKVKLNLQFITISGRKKYAFPLADLEAVDKNSNNSQMLDDYSVWFVNYR